MENVIYWNLPIEAVHRDGRVVPVALAQPEPDSQGHYQLDEYLEGGSGGFFSADGTPYTRGLGWTIRNRASVSTPTPDERAVAPELVARLVELARSVSTSPECTIAQTVEAQNILAALEPVDPMLIEARQVVADLYTGGNVTHLREQALSGEGDEWFHTKVARAALARGRQLEKEGK